MIQFGMTEKQNPEVLPSKMKQARCLQKRLMQLEQMFVYSMTDISKTQYSIGDQQSFHWKRLRETAIYFL